ncbi:helix-turn-helix domain-containing protein [Dactylosporangium sp. CA-233914]|uniref:helix-turn-helix domain-containing protein n=1 Tax=Dactylosporangium sp. CA-233914 TaxID=3239934 RepID=UPI003D8F0D12
MGRLIAAYRRHPHHGIPISQEIAGAWIGVTQGQISRMENGQPEHNIDRLIHWARLLAIPAHLLWFTHPTPNIATEPARQSSARSIGDAESSVDDAIAGTGEGPAAPRGGWLAAVRAADLTSPTLDDLDRIGAVARDARRYADAALVDYLDRRLSRSATDDGLRGPRYALPGVLGIAALVEHAVRQAKPAFRRPLLAVGARAAEFAGWLYRDCGQPAAADYWRDRASEWAMEAAEFAMPGYVLVKKSQSAWDARDAGRMLGLAQAVQEGPWQLPARVMAEAVQQQARGLAMLGAPRKDVDDALERAGELLSASAHEQTQLAAHYDAALFRLQTAICYSESGRPEEAVAIYDATLTPDMFSARDLAYFSALKAQTLAEASRVDDAATTGTAALAGALATGSARTLRELARLGDSLEPRRSRPPVHNFLRLLQPA